jgi:hypothetical protein
MDFSVAHRLVDAQASMKELQCRGDAAGRYNASWRRFALAVSWCADWKIRWCKPQLHA